MEGRIVVSAAPHGRRSLMPLTAVGDERLARLVTAGNERAFAILYERYHQTLYRYCRSIVRNDADAQDVLQSTFAGAFRALTLGRRDAPVRPWLFRIAHNEAVSLLRRRRPEDELSRATGCTMASAEELAGDRARFALLVADLHELPERQRGAVVMRELSGLSLEEIAIALGTSVGAAKQTLFEARRSLLEFAEGREMACDDVRRAISDADGRVLRARRMRAHIRECSGCAAFAAAIPVRRSQLRALAPALPTVSAAGVLSRVVGPGSGHGGAGGLAAGAAGKTVSVAVAAKAVAGVVIVASATISVATAVKPSAQGVPHPAASHATRSARANGAGGAGGAGAGGSADRAHAGAAAPVARMTARPAALTSSGPHAGALGVARAHTPVVTGGAGPTGSGPSSAGGAPATGQATAPAGSADVTHPVVGRGKAIGTQKAKGTPASANGRGRPAAPGSRRDTRGSGKPAGAAPGKPAGAAPGEPAEAESGKPAKANSGNAKKAAVAPSTTLTAPTVAPSTTLTTPTVAPWTMPGRGNDHPPGQDAE